MTVRIFNVLVQCAMYSVKMCDVCFQCAVDKFVLTAMLKSVQTCANSCRLVGRRGQSKARLLSLLRGRDMQQSSTDTDIYLV